MNKLEIFQKVYGTDHVFTVTELSRLQEIAELIVAECCEQFAKHPYVGTKRTQYIYGYIQGRVDAEQQIKQHFGVEE